MDCRNLVSHFNLVSVVFVRRGGNKVADYLATHASSFHRSVWIEDMPAGIIPLVDADVLAYVPCTVIFCFYLEVLCFTSMCSL